MEIGLDSLYSNSLADIIGSYSSEHVEGVRVDSPKDIRVLSLFSGAGGMDIGFEGGFICHRRSIAPHLPWI